ncbi:MAG: MogA/MoaB family molybdenum cofactor biosynthesis protein [Ilumatobacteraceae bacterium]|nr:MogA/MoaB family molybdenum cofactor biosynthesis protein [Ilumatobacteraceae bacterium]
MAQTQAKVLTVSDGVMARTRDDVSGRALVEFLQTSGFDVQEHRVCSDGIEAVAQALKEMADKFSGVIVTTGGTGFAPRDVTPEATLTVLERHAPGLAEAMRAVNPLGRLSRGIAGIVQNAVIINTPGSPAGCVEQLASIIDVLPHAVSLLNQIPTEH